MTSVRAVLEDLFPEATKHEVESQAWSMSPGSLILNESQIDLARTQLELRRMRTINEWHADAEKRLKWQQSLPKCPKTVTELLKDKKYIEENQEAARKYHPGAHRCFRKRVDESSAIQCCYSHNGQLIRCGAGAGTPDQNAAGKIEGLHFTGPEHLTRSMRIEQYQVYNQSPETPKLERFFSAHVFPVIDRSIGKGKDLGSSFHHWRTDVRDFNHIKRIVSGSETLQQKYGNSNINEATANIYHLLGWQPTNP